MEAYDEDEFYNRSTLYEYIDGGAELYLAYDFQEVFVRRYAGPGDTEIILDIYDMGSASEAFGVFSVEREDQDLGIGQGSEYGGGLLRFWKGRFFVSILTTGDAQKAKPAIIQAGKSSRSFDSKRRIETSPAECLAGHEIRRKTLKIFSYRRYSEQTVFYSRKKYSIAG